jgi:hypothetical protein
MIVPATLFLAALASSAKGYWLMGVGMYSFLTFHRKKLIPPRLVEDFITTERIDPIVNPGKVSSHVHSGMSSSLQLTIATSVVDAVCI